MNRGNAIKFIARAILQGDLDYIPDKIRNKYWNDQECLAEIISIIESEDHTGISLAYTLEELEMISQKKKDVLSFEDRMKKLESETPEIKDPHLFLNKNISEEEAFFGETKDDVDTETLKWFELGRNSHDHHRYVEAIFYYSKAIYTNPAFSPAFFNRASVYISIGDYTLAELDLVAFQNLESNELLLSFLASEFKNFPVMKENPVRETERKKFVAELQEAGLGNQVELVRHVKDSVTENKFQISVQSPMEGFISLTGKLNFTILVTPRSNLSVKKIEIEIYKTEDNSKLDKSFMFSDVNLSENEPFILNKNIEINQTGTFNWYMYVDNELVYQGIVYVWKYIAPKEETLDELIQKILIILQPYEKEILNEDGVIQILKDVEERIQRGEIEGSLQRLLNALRLRIEQLIARHREELPRDGSSRADCETPDLW
jgi:hypothetical protein